MWLIYHFQALIEILVVYRPFRSIHHRIPLTFRSGVPIALFSFALVCLLLIFFPLFLMLGTYFNIGIWEFGFLAPILFGILFSVIFRHVTDETVSYGIYDGNRLIHIFLRFKQKLVEVYDHKKMVGLSLYSVNYKGTTNHKICIILRDQRPILIYFSLTESLAQKKIKKFSTLMSKPIVAFTGEEPVNDSHFGMGSSSIHEGP